jgi:hypothetical protein
MSMVFNRRRPDSDADVRRLRQRWRDNDPPKMLPAHSCAGCIPAQCAHDELYALGDNVRACVSVQQMGVVKTLPLLSSSTDRPKRFL